ncbi:hypothetical protein HNP38_001191 [Chryseobacterium defluvii]|uniref:Uncharacterized protein n=1 Tax=Chryseobacterium defluvii TaxID=160396 RepID=A0A840K9B5_9FLAO|nr:transposase [Chryseobacterium defluvii]MBB4805919.1 hypothetical protein [Chryseobacterium defluvii]
MSDNLKKIHIGLLIGRRVEECQMEISRICSFFKCTEREAEQMYQLESMDSSMLLKWSKLLGYDFFRIYSQHLILYSPPVSAEKKSEKNRQDLPQFRKNIYTREVIDFVLDLVESGKKTKKQVIQEYRIPKTTLYKWISKYNNQNNE